MSLHGRDPDFITAVKENEKLGLLTDKTNNTAFIAKTLLSAGLDNRFIYVGEELSYSNEKITRLTLAEALDYEEEGLAVVVIVNE